MCCYLLKIALYYVLLSTEDSIVMTILSLNMVYYDLLKTALCVDDCYLLKIALCMMIAIY